MGKKVAVQIFEGDQQTRAFEGEGLFGIVSLEDGHQMIGYGDMHPVAQAQVIGHLRDLADQLEGSIPDAIRPLVMAMARSGEHQVPDEPGFESCVTEPAEC